MPSPSRPTPRPADRVPWARRHGYLVVGLVVLVTLGVVFVVVEQLSLPLLSDPSQRLGTGTWPVAALGVALLLGDVVLPVPSSAVMLAQGAAFGLPLGSVLALVGGTGATLVAFLVGRRGRGLVERFVSAEQRERGLGFLERHGTWAVVATRPVPLVAETVAVLAGAGTSLPWWKVALGGAVGNLVPALAYAAAGAGATDVLGERTVLAAVVALSLLAWAGERWSARRSSAG